LIWFLGFVCHHVSALTRILIVCQEIFEPCLTGADQLFKECVPDIRR
jgi:hypothetical protein